jgi:hypothetical protein
MKPTPQVQKLSRALAKLFSQYAALLEITGESLAACDETRLSDEARKDWPRVRTAVAQATADLAELRPAIEQMTANLVELKRKH